MTGDQSAKSDTEVSQMDIAEMYADILRENAVCANLSIRCGNHPWVRYQDGEWQLAERVGYGEVEVETVGKDYVISMMAANPVHLRPESEAWICDEPPTNKDMIWSVVESLILDRYDELADDGDTDGDTPMAKPRDVGDVEEVELSGQVRTCPCCGEPYANVRPVRGNGQWIFGDKPAYVCVFVGEGDSVQKGALMAYEHREGDR
jgi:hypothetical protein